MISNCKNMMMVSVSLGACVCMCMGISDLGINKSASE